MTIDFKSCDIESLWKFVASHLKLKQIDTVLSGGAVVSIYSKGAYESGDLDLIQTKLFQTGLPEAMAEIGFEKQGRTYRHPECNHIFVEFPKPPLGIGEDRDLKPAEVSFNGEIIKILSPTDCVKDRLASYIHFNDREGIDQAVLVAKAHPIDSKEVSRWCEAEGAPEAFEELNKYLSKI